MNLHALWYATSTIVAGIFVFAIAVFIQLRGRKDKSSQLFCLFSLSVAVWCFSDFGVNISGNPLAALWMTRILHVGAVFAPTLFLHFILSVTRSSTRWPALKFAYVLSFLCLFLNMTPLFIKDVTPDPVRGFSSITGPAYNLFLILFAFGASYGIYKLIVARRVATGLKKIQLTYVLISFYFVVAGGVFYFLLSIGIKTNLPPIDNVLVIIFTSILAYAVVRYRLMDINLAITRTAVFMAVYALVLGLPLLAALEWQEQLGYLLGARWWILLWILCSALATAAHYTNIYFQRKAEERLLGEQRRYQTVLRRASQGMIRIKELNRLMDLIVHLCTKEVRIRHAVIYLWDERAKAFLLEVARQWQVKEVPSFTLEDPLLRYVLRHKTPLVTEELLLEAAGGEEGLQPVVDTLRNLDATVLVPSFVEDNCLGFLILGDKVSGALYSSDDLSVFQVLANQSALAIENAQFYDELRQTQADLIQTAKMASLGHMAGGMSHQVNNRFHVLTILAGTLKSTLKGLDPASLEAEKLKTLWEKTVDVLTRIEDNALRGGDIVKTLLKFSRPSGEYQPLGVSKILSTALEVVQFRVNLNVMDIVPEIPENLPEVKGDLNQLADTCFNLISNGFDAIQKKSELIQAKQMSPSPQDPEPFRGRIVIRGRLRQEGEKTWVILEFRDNGCGMSSQDLESLFIPFFTTKATVQKGTGLGLYVIQRIVEQHGGKITVASEYGIGTTFTVQLPALPGKGA